MSAIAKSRRFFQVCIDGELQASASSAGRFPKARMGAGSPFAAPGMKQGADDHQAMPDAKTDNSRCPACGHLGHWRGDPCCPARGRENKGV